MADIVITEFMDQAAIDDLRLDFDVAYDPAMVDRPEQLLAMLDDCRGLIVRNRTSVRGELLAQAKLLQVVGRLGVGLDNIDLEVCAARSIEVCPATGANDLAVAEYVITAAMSLLRPAYQATGEMLLGDWPRGRLMGREFSAKRLGLVGLGRIAQETATRALALGMEVAAFDPFVSVHEDAWDGIIKLELDDLCQTSDVISLHVPLTEATRHLMGPARLALMKRDAILINAARGGVVDEAALAQALRGGLLGGAALDVFEVEPLTAAAAEPFAGIDNIILTPHIAGVTHESNERVSALTAANVRRVLQAKS